MLHRRTKRGLAQPSIQISSRTTTKVAPSFAIFEGWARCCLQRLCSASMASGAKKARKSSPALTARLKPCPSTNLRSRRHEPPYSKLRPLRGMGPWFPPLQRTQEWGTLSRGASPTRRRSGPSAPGNSVIPSSIDSHLSKITKRGPRPTSNRIEEFFRTAPLKPTLGLTGHQPRGVIRFVTMTVRQRQNELGNNLSLDITLRVGC